MSGFGDRLQRVVRFLGQDVWELELHSLSWVRRQLIKFVRIVLLATRGFRHDELPLRASGLTFVTLLSLAPLLAFIFTVYKGMGRGQEMILQIKASVADMPEQVQDMVNNIITYVENSSAVGLGGFAVVILIYAIIRMMGNIEHSFNKVWGITSHRTLVRKFTDYISTLVLVPMLITAAGAMSGLQTSNFWMNQPESVHEIYGRLLVFGPMFAAWIAFTILYLFMPNTRVPFVPATFSGLVASFMWLVWHRFYIDFQGWIVARQDKVFGAFASVPMFMIWLYVCWIIVLFGAELAFAIQRFDTYAREHKASKASEESRIILALALVTEMGRKMAGGGEAFNLETYARSHSVPIRLIYDVLSVLTGGGLAGRLTGEDDETYVLLRAPDQVKVTDVIHLLVRNGAPPESLGVGDLEPSASGAWQTAQDAMLASVGNRTILELVHGDAPIPFTSAPTAADS